jgi:hypothetical protein
MHRSLRPREELLPILVNIRFSEPVEDYLAIVAGSGKKCILSSWLPVHLT